MFRKSLLSIALITSFPAFAAEPPTANNYSYVEVSGRLLILDDELQLGPYTYDALPGLAGAASVQFLPYAFAFIEAAGYRQEEGETELELGALSVGGGVAYPIADQVDAIATLAYTGLTAEGCGGSFCVEVDGDGYTVGGGFRFALNEKFDLLAKYEHDFIETDSPNGSTTEDDYSNFKLELHGGQNGHGAIGGAEYQDGDVEFKLGYRYSFR